MDRLARDNVRAVEVIDVQDRAMRDEGRVRPVAGRLAGPDFNGRLRGDNTEHRAAAHRPGSHGGFPVAGRAAQLVASPARLADHGPVDMAAATVGEGAGRSRTLRTGEAARGVLHVHLGFGHGRLGYPLPSNSCAPLGKCGGPDGRRATGTLGTSVARICRSNIGPMGEPFWRLDAGSGSRRVSPAPSALAESVAG